jgi:hypothetical protein
MKNSQMTRRDRRKIAICGSAPLFVATAALVGWDYAVFAFYAVPITSHALLHRALTLH